MSTVFKKFSKSDISITPFNAHKQSTFNSASLAKNGGSFYSASFPTVAYRSGTGFEWANSGSTDDPNNHKKFFQLRHLFYNNSKLKYHNTFSKIKYFGHSRNLFNRVNILSLPYKTIGYKIKPGSLSLTQHGQVYSDDGKGNLFPQFYKDNNYLNVDEKFRIFHLAPLGAYEYYNLGIENGRELINIPSSYSQNGLDDSFLFNPVEYKNITFNTGSIETTVGSAKSHRTSIRFNGLNSTIVSPHNSRLNFNSNNDFTIIFTPMPTGYSQPLGINDNKKRYLISKSTTKTVIQSPNLANSTRISGSSQTIDVSAESQFPFEIYHQSQSYFFKRFDGDKTTEISANMDGLSKLPLAFVKSGSELQIWNGSTKISSGSDNTKQCQNQANLYIGSKGATSNFYTGSIEDIMIFEKALNFQELNTTSVFGDSTVNIGNIFYDIGLVTITHPKFQSILNPFNSSGVNDFQLKYQGTHLIYENEYQCMAEQHEFDVTLNPSARKIKSKNSEDLANFATGSNFKPYVTTVGLYNDNGELLVVGKLGQAIRMTDEADTTYVVRFDT